MTANPADNAADNAAKPEPIPVTRLKLTTIGSSTGVILPKAMLEKMRVSKGDTLHAIETPDGYRLVPYDPQFAQQMGVAERVMRERRDALRRLAE